MQTPNLYCRPQKSAGSAVRGGATENCNAAPPTATQRGAEAIGRDLCDKFQQQISLCTPLWLVGGANRRGHRW